MAPRTNNRPAAGKQIEVPKKPIIDQPTPAVEPEVLTVIAPPSLQIHGRQILQLNHGDYMLRIFQDNSTNAIVTYFKDDVVGILRGFRRDAVTTYGLHVGSIVRLAINESEEAASNYLGAAQFFDNNLQAFAQKALQRIELEYSYGDHKGYLLIGGKSFLTDDHAPSAAAEDIYRALPYVKNFIDTYSNNATDSALAAAFSVTHKPQFHW